MIHVGKCMIHMYINVVMYICGRAGGHVGKEPTSATKGAEGLRDTGPQKFAQF